MITIETTKESYKNVVDAWNFYKNILEVTLANTLTIELDMSEVITINGVIVSGDEEILGALDKILTIL